MYSALGANRMLEVKKLRESLTAREKYGRASIFMQMELTLAQGLEMKASVGAALGLCNVMNQTENEILLFRAARLGRQLSGILLPLIPQLGEQLSHQATSLLDQIFPELEDQCPAIFFENATTSIRSSASAECEKYREFMDLSTSARERKDFTRANQALIEARDAAQKHWIQNRLLASGSVALQGLRDFHKLYIDLHRNETGIAFFESAGINDYLVTLFVHVKDYDGVLQTFEAFQKRHVDYEIPTHQERALDIAIRATRALAMEDRLQQYTARHFDWLKKCSFSEQWGSLKDSAISDPDQYIRQISRGAEDLKEWGSNALALILALVKMEWKRELLSTDEVRDLLSFTFTSEKDEKIESIENFLEELDFEDAAESLYGSLDRLTPSARLIETMQRLKHWLNRPDRLPSRAARLATAKIVMQSRLYRVRLYLARKGVPNEVDTREYADEQQLLDEIEELEHNAAGGQGDYLERKRSSSIQVTLNKCYVPEAGTKGLISDEELQAKIGDCAELVTKYANGGQRFPQYHISLQQSRLYWQRYLHFRCVPPDAGLEVLEEAEKLFNEIRKQILSEDPAQSFTATITLTEDLMSQEHLKMALAATLQSFWGKLAAAQESQSLGILNQSLFEIALEHYHRFLKWTYRSKDRVLTDLLLRSRIQKSSREKKELATSVNESDLSRSVQELHISDKTTLQGEVKRTTPLNDPVIPLKLPSIEFDEEAVSKVMINQMLNQIGDEVVIVDIINLAYLAQGGSQAILYRKGTPNILPIPLPDLTIKTVEVWALKNLGTSENSIKRPLGGNDNVSALEELTPLLMPLFNADLPQYIKPNEVIIFCLTGALHRIPIHAVPVNGTPLIERNPIAYCSSLTTLYRGFQTISKVQPSSRKVESLAIVPSYREPWITDAEAERHLLQQIERTSAGLNAEPLIGPSLNKKIVQASSSKRAHIHYFGHVRYDSKTPLHSALLLNDAALKEPLLSSPDSESLTVRDLFSCTLQKPTLVTLIGCGSGQSLISSSDDVLGLPSAFQFAGASAIVSTLWPISADDGAEFAAQLYHAYHQRQWQQQQSSASPAGIKVEGRTVSEADAGGMLPGLKDCVNLAYVMQDAMEVLRRREKGKAPAYHWAGFYLTGFWLFRPLSWDDNGKGDENIPLG